jgi:hypothetical protein
MNLSQFFEHWSIIENPFRGEEARHDTVFARMAMYRDTGTAASAAANGGGGTGGAAGIGSGASHSDFEKILGELDRPSSAIVFGEKGSGKTAIRLQLADRVIAYNASHPRQKALLLPYDDLNTFLDRLLLRVSGRDGKTGSGPATASGGRDTLAAFQQIRLVDHLDALIGMGTTGVVDALVNAGQPSGRITVDLGVEPTKTARRMDLGTRKDLLLLQAIYDEADRAHDRTARLRRVLRLTPPFGAAVLRFLARWGWIPLLAVAAWLVAVATPEQRQHPVTLGLVGVLVALYLLVAGKALVVDRFRLGAVARKIRKQIRVAARGDDSYAASLAQIDPSDRQPVQLPLTDSDDQRYAMLARLRRVLAGFGYTGLLVIIDRVDEPTLVSGDPDRMRSIIWPTLNNKFLQQDGVGVKMLLPIELRHMLFKESSSFFQEARLDKQNLVERLNWTGAMLYDLCDARLRACRAAGAQPITLLDLFAEDVTRKDLVDALDQMHQPRDAFKFLYACMTEHCSNVTREDQEYRIPRLVLETVRKQQSDRVQQLYRGIRPA